MISEMSNAVMEISGKYLQYSKNARAWNNLTIRINIDRNEFYIDRNTTDNRR